MTHLNLFTPVQFDGNVPSKVAGNTRRYRHTVVYCAGSESFDCYINAHFSHRILNVRDADRFIGGLLKQIERNA